MTTRRDMFLLPLLLVLPAARAECGAVVMGTYELPRMRALRHLTFPRVLLYDRAGALIDRTHWPEVLSAVKTSAGDAFCCISEQPTQPDQAGPPADCRKIVYGADVNEHFRGLIDASQRPLLRSQLPRHEHLIVEYYASWCSPCIASRSALQRFMQSDESRGYVSLIVDFSALQG